MVVVLHHSPHAVEPRPVGSGTRHCTLFSYRAPDPGGCLPVTTNADLQPWELERDAALGKLVAALTAICGIAVIAIPIGIISAGFTESLGSTNSIEDP